MNYSKLQAALAHAADRRDRATLHQNAARNAEADALDALLELLAPRLSTVAKPILSAKSGQYKGIPLRLNRLFVAIAEHHNSRLPIFLEVTYSGAALIRSSREVVEDWPAARNVEGVAKTILEFLVKEGDEAAGEYEEAMREIARAESALRAIREAKE